MGHFSGAAELFHDALAISRREVERRVHDHVMTQVALELAWSFEESQRAEAQELALEVVREEAPHPHMLGRVCVALAKLAVERGHWHEAESQARRACELLAVFLPTRVLARAVLSSSLLAQGRVKEAREEARLGVQDLEQMGGAGFPSIRGYLAMAEACFADGDMEAGEPVLRRALQSLRIRSQDIPDSERPRFQLHRVPENARVIQWARERWGSEDPGTGV
jgi:ATP/maltotriose-dependent transcriptional regulator MalT